MAFAGGAETEDKSKLALGETRLIRVGHDRPRRESVMARVAAAQDLVSRNKTSGVRVTPLAADCVFLCRDCRYAESYSCLCRFGSLRPLRRGTLGRGQETASVSQTPQSVAQPAVALCRMKTNALLNTPLIALLAGLAIGLGIVVHDVFFLVAAAIAATVPAHWLLRHLQHHLELAQPAYRHG